MGKKINYKVVGTLIIIALIVSGIVVAQPALRAAAIGEIGYLVPAIGHAECTVLNPNAGFPSDYNKGWDIPEDTTEWYCGAELKPYGVDKTNHVKKCDYQITINKRTAWWNPTRKGIETEICTIGGDCEPHTSTLTGKGIWLDHSSISSNQYIKTKGASGFLWGYNDGDFSFRAKADVYGIQVEYSNGLLGNYPAGCDIRVLKRNTLLERDADKIVNNTIPFDTVVNWIGGSTPIYSAINIIPGSVVGETGEIYVISAGNYYKVLSDRTLNGLKIVDSSRIFKSDAIECVPESSWCSNAAKLKEDFGQAGKDCSVLAGVAPGWYPSDDPKEICTLKCKDGVIQEDECKEIPDCNPFSETLDKDFNCVDLGKGIGGVPGGDDIFKLLPWILAGAAIAFAFLVLIVWALTRNKGGVMLVES